MRTRVFGLVVLADGLVAYTRATEVKGKWPVIISWIAHQLFMACYNFSDYFDISFDFEIKRKRKRYCFKKIKKEKKKKKSSICLHRESSLDQLIQSPTC